MWPNFHGYLRSQRKLSFFLSLSSFSFHSTITIENRQSCKFNFYLDSPFKVYSLHFFFYIPLWKNIYLATFFVLFLYFTLQLFHNFNIKKYKRISPKLHRQSQLKKFSFDNFFDFFLPTKRNINSYVLESSKIFHPTSTTNRQKRKENNMIGFSNRGKKTEESVLPTKVSGLATKSTVKAIPALLKTRPSLPYHSLSLPVSFIQPTLALRLMERIATNDGKVKAVSDCKWTEGKSHRWRRFVQFVGERMMTSRHAGTRRKKDILFEVTIFQQHDRSNRLFDYFLTNIFYISSLCGNNMETFEVKVLGERKG